MTQLSFSQVEEWLDEHVDLCQDYFLRKGELILINKWLLAHGFCTINEYINAGRRNSSTFGNSNFYSSTEEANDNEKSPPPTVLINGNDNGNLYQHKRTNSKKCLRHDFARTKSKSFVKSTDVGNGINYKEVTKCRRSSLKDMRK